MHTDTNEDTSMAEEDLGLEDDFANRRVSAGFGSHSRINTGTIKASLPCLKINVPLSMPTRDIFDIFKAVSAKEKFQIIELEQTIATAVYKEPLSIKRMFLKCLPFASDKGGNIMNSSPISALRLHISVNDVKGCRKITLKGLYGDSDLLKTFIAEFRLKLQAHVKKDPSQAAGDKNSQQQRKNRRQTTLNNNVTTMNTV